jgi:hypothetical protein
MLIRCGYTHIVRKDGGKKMTNNNKNAHENVYRHARLRASAYNSLFSSMDTTYDQLFIGRRTLWEIENGVTTPDSNTVLNMAELYNAPELITHYCASDCPLGRARGVQLVENMSPERIALNTTSLLYKSEECGRSLIEAAKDGVISDSERPAILEVITWINQLAHLRDELVVVLERKMQ